MFRTVPLFIIRSVSLYTQQWYMSYKFAVSKPVWHIPLLCVQWNTPDDKQRNCPKHVEFYSKNKFEILVNLVGFIIRMEYSTVFVIELFFQTAVRILLIVLLDAQPRSGRLHYELCRINTFSGRHFCQCRCWHVSQYAGMRRTTTFRSTTDRIYDGCPIKFIIL